MENLLFSANAVSPVFIVMIIGWFLKRKEILPQGFWDGLSKYIFVVATPLLLFSDTSSVDFSAAFDIKFIITAIGALLATVLIFWIVYPIIIKDRVKTGAMIHCSYRSNFAILGLPLLKNMLSAVGIAKAEMLLAIGVPVFNTVAVLCLAYWSDSSGNYKKMVMNIVKNPLIIGCLSGLLFSLFKIPIPLFCERTITYLGNTALGLGLLLLGASFEFEKFAKNLKQALSASFAKLVFSPFFGIVVSYLLGFRGEELLIVLVYLGSSTAVNSYVMAKEMKSDSELTSGIVVCTTGLSILTLFVGIFIVKTFLIQG